MRLSRRAFFRRLPRPVRWLWFAILAVVAVECAGIGLGLVLGDAWLWTAIQLLSILAGPLALGMLVVIGAGVWSSRELSARAGEQPGAERRPAPPASPQIPLEVAAGRRAGQALAALAQSPKGKVAIRQAARLVRAVRAAAHPAPESTEADEPERR